MCVTSEKEGVPVVYSVRVHLVCVVREGSKRVNYNRFIMEMVDNIIVTMGGKMEGET